MFVEYKHLLCLPVAVDMFALLFDDVHVAVVVLLFLIQLPRQFLLHTEFLEHHMFCRRQILAFYDREKR